MYESFCSSKGFEYSYFCFFQKNIKKLKSKSDYFFPSGLKIGTLFVYLWIIGRSGAFRQFYFYSHEWNFVRY